MHDAGTSCEGVANPRAFSTTHWSVVFAAKDDDSRRAALALETLCRSYWPPLYGYLRRSGYGAEDAQDLTQEFLGRLVHREWLSHLQDRRGKFRSFLLTLLKHFLADQRDHARAQKRGGGQRPLSLEQLAEEEQAWAEPSERETPELAYERRWAKSLLEQAARLLRCEYAQTGREQLYEVLKDLQPGERGAHSYADLGAQLGVSEQAVKNAVHRLRRRHREILRAEIARTVEDPEDVAAEIQHLMNVLAR